MMGCVSSSVKSVARKRSSSVPHHEFLSDSERLSIRDTWREISRDLAGNGSRVFLRIFELCPSVRSLFNFRFLSDEDLLNDSLFRTHASRFMQAVDLVLLNIDALDIIITQNLIRLGRHHARIDNFRLEYLDVFQTAMMDVWRMVLGPTRFNRKCRRAWRKIFRLITSKVLEGFRLQRLNFSNMTESIRTKISTLKSDDEGIQASYL